MKMSFIGIVATKKIFENIKRKVLEEINDKTINFIQINLRSIENVKNIKFETVIIEDNVEKFKENINILEIICNNSQYIIINTDKNPEYEKIKSKKNVITYGLNQKATVTVSSNSDTDILIYLQENIENKEKDRIEIEERRIKKEERSRLKTYEILIIYILLRLYNISIIKEI